MSEPKRYIISGLHPHIYESKDGFMVYYEDYARLKADAQLVVKHLDEACADNLRLKADVVELADALKLASEVGIKVADEVTRLKAEVERLRKAGDAMADEYRRMCKGEPAAGWFHRLMAGNEDFKIEHLDAWNAAKEGKQP